MARYKPSPKTRLEKRLAKELEEAIAYNSDNYNRGFDDGKRTGLEKGKKEQASENLSKAQAQMLQSLSVMVESVSRAIIAFSTECSYK